MYCNLQKNAFLAKVAYIAAAKADLQSLWLPMKQLVPFPNIEASRILCMCVFVVPMLVWDS